MDDEQPSTTAVSGLRQAVALISSLISLSLSIRVFAGKWQLIRSRLEELHSGLVAGDATSLSGELPKITGTAEECRELARRCVDLSYSGKLLMQSDLDVTLGKFYLRDLLTRMKVGDSGMKKQALMNLHEVIVEDEKYVKLVVEVSEFVHVLVDFLGSLEVEVVEEAAKVVSVVVGFDSHKGVLVGAGVIAPLIRVLECGSEVGKVGAARCLQRLTENSDNAWCVSAHGGVTALLRVCESEELCKGELVGPSCGVLRNLCGVEEIKRFMVEDGVVSTFVRLVRSRDEVVQVSSIELIQSIASGDELVRQMVIREGGVRVLFRVLDPKLTCSSKTREVVMRAIENLFFSSPSCVSVLMSYGFVDQLMYYVRNGEVSIQELALKVAFRLCEKSEEAKKALGDAGFMAELVKFLNAKSYEVREMAAEALSGMVMVAKNRKRFVQDDQNIALLLQLLDPGESNSGNKKLLISILMSLTSCNSGRKKIVSSGYAKNIERFAEAEVSSDAKRLVRKLSANRFRSMLSGIWHS
uniref:Vacuolar protein 8 n=1 Tax=Cajanus cajan TaxID=3821 RepID=A0A151T7K2_CAJCA|nr:Vacuolar protein 8 [Cajanus cajan]